MDIGEQCPCPNSCLVANKSKKFGQSLTCLMTYGQKSPPNYGLVYGPMLTLFSGVDEDLNDTIYEMDAMIFTASQEMIHFSTMIRQL